MLRGTIEVATPALVSGWVFCKHTSLRDQLVLAFADGACIGTGRVQYFRQDLLMAGLGDGYCGFHFPVKLPPTAQCDGIVIRLAESDFELRQVARMPVAADAE